MKRCRMHWSIKSTVLAVLVAVGILLVSPPVFASPMQFDFVSEPAIPQTQAGAYIEFAGAPTNTVTFPDAPSTGYDFVITQSDTAALIGIRGNISGTFTVGSITTVGLLQTASVTGTGTFSLTDPDGNVLSAALVWSDIYTYGSDGALNSDDAANLTSWTYSGSYPSFLDILTGQDPSSNVTFQFNPAKKLSQLMAAGADTLTTYSGSFSMTPTVPEPATLSLLALGGFLLLRGKKAKAVR
jgi:hypothetical protein